MLLGTGARVKILTVFDFHSNARNHPGSSLPKMTAEPESNEPETGEFPVNSPKPVEQWERRPVLVSLRGELLGTPIPLDRDRVIFGRALDADIRLNDFKTSRVHAAITAEVDETTGVR